MNTNPHKAVFVRWNFGTCQLGEQRIMSPSEATEANLIFRNQGIKENWVLTYNVCSVCGQPVEIWPHQPDLFFHRSGGPLCGSNAYPVTPEEYLQIVDKIVEGEVTWI